MLRLFLNATGGLETVALIHNGKILARKSWHANYDESEIVLPILTVLLNKTKKSFHDLTDIVVTRGPGSFSSTRIGVTIANTLGFALGIPVHGISHVDFSKILKQTYHRAKQRWVIPLYSKPPNITKAKGIRKRFA